MDFGAFGNRIPLGNVIFAGLLAAALPGCSSDTRYSGSLQTTQGACGLGFDSQGMAKATLVLRGTNATFAPTDGVTVLGGNVNGAGHVLVSSNTTGADKKPFPQVFEGDQAGSRVRGTFATPRCRATAELTQD